MKIRQGVILMALFLLGTDYATAQEADIKGQLLDEQTGEPIPYAQILLENTVYLTTTDLKGNFILNNVKHGKYWLIASMVGYTKIKKEVIVNNESIIYFTLTLSPDIAELEEVVINAEKENNFGIKRLNAVEGTAIYAGKKSAVIIIEDITANTATNNSRQIYAKVPGLNIWESDGAGLQLGIGGRGLNPKRVSSFNTRQNGYDISADALGYPESYYTPPTEAVERIEIVRGAASLQYGTQFGGFINFKLKEGPKDKLIELTSRQTGGSFGFFNTFNSLGGTVGKVNYYSFYQHKRGDGWRPNAEFYTNTAFGAVNYQVNKRLSVSAEYTFMNYLAHQPGGLTDEEFKKDPRQSNRERNWFKVNWNLASVSADYKFADHLKLNTRFFGLIASRSALGILNFINRADPMQERDLWIDEFKNFGNETRVLYNYYLNNNLSAFLIGVRYYDGFTHRRQGLANVGKEGKKSDFSFINIEEKYAEYEFPSRNRAIFAENIFQINKRLSITPGIRFEYIETNADGYYNQVNRDFAGNIILNQRIKDKRSNSRSFVLLGIGSSYILKENIEGYANFSQNYRSINFSDIRTGNKNLFVDPELRDEKGFTADIGVRGSLKKIVNFDMSVFMIRYNDRIGGYWPKDTTFVYRYRTNISDARNIGLESFIEADIWKLIKGNEALSQLSVFSNFSIIDARYVDSKEAAFENRKVELAPSVLLKTGLTFKRKALSVSYQYSYTSAQFTDATNAKSSNTAVIGIIPSYCVMDLSAEYTYRFLTFATGINNLTNNMYYTRRAEGYPGPGIIPSDGRSFYFTLQVKM